MSCGAPWFALAVASGARLGIWLALPLIPLVWLGLGFSLCFACVLTKRNIGPRLSPRHPIPVFSGDFARWWLVSVPTPAVRVNVSIVNIENHACSRDIRIGFCLSCCTQGMLGVRVQSSFIVSHQETLLAV